MKDPVAGGRLRRPVVRRLAVAGAVLGLAATVAAGLDLFAVRPRVDRFFAPGASGVQVGGSSLPPSPAKAAEELRRPAPRPAPVTLIAPVPGRVILGYGWKFSPTLADWRFHAGVDLAGPEGQPVVAAASGTVTAVRASRLLGGVVRLDVGGGEVCTYEGLARMDVRAGQSVQAGQELGAIGPTPPAEVSEPPHVQWQVSRNGHAVDPESLRLATPPAT